MESTFPLSDSVCFPLRQIFWKVIVAEESEANLSLISVNKMLAWGSSSMGRISKQCETFKTEIERYLLCWVAWKFLFFFSPLKNYVFELKLYLLEDMSVVWL